MARRRKRGKCTHGDERCIYTVKNVRLKDGTVTGLPIMRCPRCWRATVFPEKIIPSISDDERKKLDTELAKKGITLSWDE
jgi:hypothetical protein